MAARQPPSSKPDRITQIGRSIGLGGIVVLLVFWLITTREPPTDLIGVCALLWGGTEGVAALKGLGRK